jgi:hypothetical protein
MHIFFKLFLFFNILLYSLNAGDFDIQGDIDFTSQFYLKRPTQKNPNDFTTSANLEINYLENDLQIKSKLYAQGDYYHRSFLRLDELYLQYDMENDQLQVGKNIRFWGALEVQNIADDFNQRDLRSDPFDADKIGAWNISWTHFTETGELSFIVKGYEQSLKAPDKAYVYYYFPETIQGRPLSYSDTLHTESGDTRPSYYLKYSGSTDTQYPLDYAIILENGYDSQRYYDIEPSPTYNDFSIFQNAYIVNKIISYDTLVVDNTLYKLEALYANVKSSNENNVSDYFHLGLGMEHTLTQVYKEADLGLLAEYYYYDTLDADKKTDLDLFEVFQNDLFLGLRYSFNEGNDASIVSGVILDFDYNEQVYYFKYESRIADVIKLNFDYRYIKPSQNTLTAFHLMGTHERISMKLGYYF